MSVAHDASSESHTGTTGSVSETSFSWSHVPAGTPRGAVVFVLTAIGTPSETGVTYGGTPMALVLPESRYASGEQATVHAYFLGKDVPSGTQTVVVSRTNNANVMYANAVTVTASTDTDLGSLLIDASLAAYAQRSVDDGIVSTTSVRYCFGYYGGAAPPTVGANSTTLQSIDLGNYTVGLVRETTAGNGSRLVGFTDASDDRAAIYLAVRERPTSGAWHDNASASHEPQAYSASETSFSWTHGGAADAKGVFVTVFTRDGTPLDTSVTYGGESMTLVSQLTAVDTATEQGSERTYFLGAGVPGGPQTVVVNRTSSAIALTAIAVTVLSVEDETEIDTAAVTLLQADGTLAEQAINPSSADASIRYSVGYSGAAPAALAAAGAASSLIVSRGFAGGTSSIILAAELEGGTGSRSVGWTYGTSDDRAIAHFAVQSVPSSVPEVALEEVVTGLITTGDSVTTASWTPGADELVLVSVSMRTTSITPTVAGNGLTFVVVQDHISTQNQSRLVVFRAMGASPSTGVVTVTVTGNTKSVGVIASRFSGVDTSGTNGSGAIEASSETDTGGTDTNDMIGSVTTVTANAWAWAASCQRNRTFTLPGGQTIIHDDLLTGAVVGGDEANTSQWYIGPVATPGATSLGGTDDLNSTTDWIVIAASIKPGSSGTPGDAVGDLQTLVGSILAGSTTGAALTAAGLQSLVTSQFSATPSGAAALTAALQAFASSPLAATASGKGIGAAALQLLASSQFGVAVTGAGAVTGDLTTLVSSLLAAAASGSGAAIGGLQLFSASVQTPTVEGAAAVTAALLGAASGQLTAAAGGQAATTAALLTVPTSVFDASVVGAAVGDASLLVLAQSIPTPTPTGGAAVTGDLSEAAWSIFPATAGVPAFINADLLTLAIEKFVDEAGGAAAVSDALQTLAATLLAPSATGQAIAASGMLLAASDVFAAAASGAGNVSAGLLTQAATVLAVVVGGQGNITAPIQSVTTSVFDGTAKGAGSVTADLNQATLSVFTHNASGGGGEGDANADLLSLLSSQFAVTVQGKAFIAAEMVGLATQMQANSAKGAAAAEASLLLLSATLQAAVGKGAALTMADLASLTSDIFAANGSGAATIGAQFTAISIQLLVHTAEGDFVSGLIGGHHDFETSILANELTMLSIFYELTTHESVFHTEEVTSSILDWHAQEAA